MRFLVLPLDLLGAQTTGLQGRFRVCVRLPCGRDPGPKRIHSGGQRSDLASRRLTLRRLTRHIGVDLCELTHDLLAARLEALGKLRQAHMVEFQLVMVFLQIRDGPSQAFSLRAALLEFSLPGHRDGALPSQFLVGAAVLREQCFNFTLA